VIFPFSANRRQGNKLTVCLSEEGKLGLLFHSLHFLFPRFPEEHPVLKFFFSHKSHVHARVLMSSEPDQERNKLIFLSEWREFLLAPCLAGKKKNKLMTARVSMLLKSRPSLIRF